MSTELSKITTLLKDVVILKLHKRPTGTISGLVLPEAHRVPIELIPGEVIMIGSKFRFKNEVDLGDILWVPSQFGNAVNQFDESIRFYDGEDCHAIMKKKDYVQQQHHVAAAIVEKHPMSEYQKDE